ncbi:hypothetical protein K8I31_14645, partial [bacterium]|nr:hypothetical protein [bacterium]
MKELLIGGAIGFLSSLIIQLLNFHRDTEIRFNDTLREYYADLHILVRKYINEGREKLRFLIQIIEEKVENINIKDNDMVNDLPYYKALHHSINESFHEWAKPLKVNRDMLNDKASVIYLLDNDKEILKKFDTFFYKERIM